MFLFQSNFHFWKHSSVVSGTPLTHKKRIGIRGPGEAREGEVIKSLFSIHLSCPSPPDPIFTSISITSHTHESEIGALRLRLKHFAGSFSQIPSHCSSSLFLPWSLSHPSVVRPSRKGNESPKASELGTRQHPLLRSIFASVRSSTSIRIL